jgi:hypothetical protein
LKKVLLIAAATILGFLFFSCSKESAISEKTNLLTSHIWVADSLLLDGEDASGPGGVLENFNGDTKFNEDGTGYVGQILGTWEFFSNETQILISSDSLDVPVTLNIKELTSESLKVTTVYPNLDVFPPVYLDVRMTFKPKE